MLKSTIIFIAFFGVAYAGFFGDLFGRKSSEERDEAPRPTFLRDVNGTERRSWFEIEHNKNSTKAEIQTLQDQWAANQTSEVQDAYNTFKQARTEFIQSITSKADEIAAGLSQEAQNIYNQIKEIRQNQDISRSEECDEIRDTLANVTREVRRELKPLKKFAGKCCHRRHGGGEGEFGPNPFGGDYRGQGEFGFRSSGENSREDRPRGFQNSRRKNSGSNENSDESGSRQEDRSNSNENSNSKSNEKSNSKQNSGSNENSNSNQNSNSNSNSNENSDSNENGPTRGPRPTWNFPDFTDFPVIDASTDGPIDASTDGNGNPFPTLQPSSTTSGGFFRNLFGF